jgi:hypothetical protein
MEGNRWEEKLIIEKFSIAKELSLRKRKEIDWRFLQWSTNMDGKLLIIAYDSRPLAHPILTSLCNVTMIVYDVKQKSEKCRKNIIVDGVDAFCWSSDGRTIYYQGVSGVVGIDIDTLKSTSLHIKGVPLAEHDGRLYISRDRFFEIVKIDKKKEVVSRFDLGEGRIFISPAYLCENQFFATMMIKKNDKWYDYKAVAMDLSNGSVLAEVEGILVGIGQEKKKEKADSLDKVDE